MPKVKHELRDGLYGFIAFDNLEKRLIDSTPFQRLRCIHQLAMCYQVYPGATHKRFEHSLGVMEIAGRIFDTVFDKRLSDNVQDGIEEELQPERKQYWRRVVRIAALLHDVGHLPFSHAAESELLPDQWNHERITAEIIRHSEIADILRSERPPIDPEDVVDLAWDIRKRSKVEPDQVLSPWKTVLNEILTGNTFGADRIDYLLRDSWHAGVAYGRFDPDRLVNSLRAVVDPKNGEISVALDIGGIHAAEALLLARYFMYTQVYMHDVRRVYDLHLKDFLKSWLSGGRFNEGWESLLCMSDHEVIVAMRTCASNDGDPLHVLAARVLRRKHFRTVYELVGTHRAQVPTIFEDIRDFAVERFGEENIRFDSYGPSSESNDFLVMIEDGSAVSSLEESGVVANVPPIQIGLVFAAPEIVEDARIQINSKLRELVDRRISKGSRKGASRGR